MSSPAVVRHMGSEDFNFLKNSFLKSFRNSSFTRKIPNDQYYGVYSPLIEQLLASEKTTVAVAVNPEDPQHIYGWSIWEKFGPTQILHYVYCKLPYRSFGIAKQLLEESGFRLAEPFFYTLAASSSDSLSKHYSNAVHNPFLLLQVIKPANDNQ